MEVSNWMLVNGIKKHLRKAKGNWTDELPQVLWSERTTPRTSTNEAPFSLAYGTEEVLPTKLMIGLIRTTHFQSQENDKDLRQNLDLLEERRA